MNNKIFFPKSSEKQKNYLINKFNFISNTFADDNSKDKIDKNVSNFISPKKSAFKNVFKNCSIKK